MPQLFNSYYHAVDLATIDTAHPHGHLRGVVCRGSEMDLYWGASSGGLPEKFGSRRRGGHLNHRGEERELTGGDDELSSKSSGSIA